MQRSCIKRARRAASLLASTMLTACAGTGPAPAGRENPGLVAAATIAPLTDLVRRVAGPAWVVHTIVPPGISPHVFEPAPRHVRALAGARVLVAVGAGYDAWAASLSRAAASRAALLDASAAVGVHEAATGGHDHAHESRDTDPHWWLSPERTRRLVPALVAALTASDPRGREGYEARGAHLDADLAALDARLAATLRPFEGATFVSSHAAWGWFADRYGLREAGAIEPVPGREPSPRELANLLAVVRREGLRTLFTEPQFPASAARVVARDAGLAVATLDPIGGGPGTATYADTLTAVAAGFASGLREARR